MTRLENRFLVISAGGNLGMAVLGFIFAAITNSRAILLDGLFDLVYFLAAIFTFKAARLVHREDDDRFPYGYAYFEPLVNGAKGLLVLGVSIMALVDAVDTMLSGGRSIAAGWAIFYALLASIGCMVLALVVRRGASISASPLLVADAKNWIVNTAISGCVVIAFGSILLLQGTPYSGAIPYVDPGVVVGVIAVTIAVPLHLTWAALMELLNRAVPREVSEEVRTVILDSTSSLPVKELYVRVIQPGRTRMVLSHVVLPSDYSIESLAVLDAIREKTQERLRQRHLATILDLVFTGDRAWGAPIAIPTDEAQA